MAEIQVNDNAHWLSLWKEWAQPDRTYIFAPGEYDRIALKNVANVTARAADPANPPLIRCLKPDGTTSNQGIWAVDCPNFTADGFVVRGAKENGVQVGGTNYVSATLQNLTVQDTGSAFSNNDAVKLTRVEDFLVENVVVEKFAKSFAYGGNGSAVDMVSCRNGVIQNCRFANNLTIKTTCQGVQMKGGSRDVTIRNNRFSGCGRAISFGGGQSDGVQDYLPAPGTLPAPSAQFCRAWWNVIENSGAGLWFQNSQDCTATENLVINPGENCVKLWHSLDPNVDTFKRLTLLRNVFIHNLKRDDVIKHAVPQPGDGIDSVTYEGNWWYCPSPTGQHFPLYPGNPTIIGEVYGVNPQVRPDEWPHALPSIAGSLPYPTGEVEPPVEPPTDPPTSGTKRYRITVPSFTVDVEEIQ